jgi:Domain of unknown function (DUF4279)
MRTVAVVRTYASLSIHHAELSARHVTDRLGIEPTTSFEHGELYARSKHRTQSGWDLASGLPGEGGDLEHHLRALVDRLLPVRDIAEELAAEGYRMKWSCFISEENGQGGIDLSYALIRDLALVPVDLWFDLYVEDEPEE